MLTVQAQKFTLSGSGCSATATSITLTSFKLLDGTNITMTDFGSDVGYGTLEPGTSREESIKFTGITQNGNGTATLTGVTRGVRFVSPFDEVSGNKKAHGGGTVFVLSNTSAMYSEFVDIDNAQTINGLKTFAAIPVLPASDPTTSNQATRKAYVDTKLAIAGTETVTGQKTFPSADANRARIDSDVDTAVATAFVTLGQLSRQAISGAANASTTVKGLVQEATSAEVLAGTATGSTGARLFMNPSTAGALIPIGLVLDFAGNTVPTGWLECDGSAVSRSTYANLFSVIGTTWGSGNGSTTFNLPDLRNRTSIGSGTSTKVATFVSRSSNVITVSGISNVANNEFQTGQAILYSAPSGAMTGLTHNTTYYLVRTGNLTFSLATTLANAQNGTVITLSSNGTGTQTFTLTLTARTVGDTGGEENHAMNSGELLAHNHPGSGAYVGGAGGSEPVLQANSAPAAGFSSAYLSIASQGGNTAMNNMQPFAVVKKIIKF